MRIQNASDVTAQTRLRLAYITNVPAGSGYTGVNAYRSKGMQNGYSFLLQVQKGFRECTVASGGPFAMTTGTVTNTSGTSVTIPNTIPVTL